jgi:hypothetical protein
MKHQLSTIEAHINNKYKAVNTQNTTCCPVVSLLASAADMAIVIKASEKFRNKRNPVPGGMKFLF